MSQNLNVELTESQRDVLLQGLRFVRSSIMLDVYDPTPELVEKRQIRLKDITSLTDQLAGVSHASTEKVS